MTPQRKERGFTLLEVLVALIIVAFGMSAVLAALSSAADTTGRLRDKSLAEWIAFNQISTTRLTLQAPSTGTTTGALDYANGKWAWSQEISELDIPGILRITVKVRRDDGSGAPSADQPVDWLATAIGFRGDALNSASGESVNWNGKQLAGGAGTAGTSTGTTTGTGTASGSGENANTAERDASRSGGPGNGPPGGRTGGGPGGPPGQPPGPPPTPANPGNGG